MGNPFESAHLRHVYFEEHEIIKSRLLKIKNKILVTDGGLHRLNYCIFYYFRLILKKSWKLFHTSRNVANRHTPTHPIPYTHTHTKYKINKRGDSAASSSCREYAWITFQKLDERVELWVEIGNWAHNISRKFCLVPSGLMIAGKLICKKDWDQPLGNLSNLIENFCLNALKTKLQNVIWKMQQRISCVPYSIVHSLH